MVIEVILDEAFSMRVEKLISWYCKSEVVVVVDVLAKLGES